jgi:hypothetical protein
LGVYWRRIGFQNLGLGKLPDHKETLWRMIYAEANLRWIAGVVADSCVGYSAEPF